MDSDSSTDRIHSKKEIKSDKTIGEWDGHYRKLSSYFSRRRAARRRPRTMPRTEKEMKSYDRADMYVEDFVNYMGIPMAGDHTHKIHFPGCKVEDHEKIVYFMVDDVDSKVTNEQIFNSWQTSLMRSKKLPQKLAFSVEPGSPVFDVSHAHPTGDEWIFSNNPVDSKYVGAEQYMGKVWITKPAN